MRVSKLTAVAALSLFGLVASGASSKANIYYSVSDYNTGTGASLSIDGWEPNTETLVGVIIATDEGNSGGTNDVPSSDLASTEMFINDNTTPSWNTDLVFKSTGNTYGDCTGTDCKSFTGLSLPGVHTVVLKFDNVMAAFLWDSPITSLSVSGLPAGMSHYDYGDPVPLPPAALLFGTALVGLGALGRRRRKQKALRVTA